MKIEKSVFQSFLEAILLKGEHQNKECILSVNKDGLGAVLLSADGTTAIRAKLKVAVQKGAEEELGIDNLPLLVEAVKTFKEGDINLAKTKNKLVVSQGKQKATLILRDTEYIKNGIEEAKLETLRSKEAVGFEMELPVIKEICSFLNSFKSKALRLEGEGAEFSVYIENNENAFEKAYEVGEGINLTKFVVLLGSPFVDILNSVKTKISLRVSIGKALECVVSNDNMNIEYYVATMKE
jgi:hypothetical protein